MNPLAFLAPYKLWIEIAVLVALIGGGVIAVHKFLSYEQQIGYDRAEAIYTKQLAEAQAAAMKREVELKAQVETALKGAKDREIVIQKSATAAASAAGSLRATLDGVRAGVPSATVQALRDATTTLSTVFGDCADRYQGLAEKADRHASDVRTLSEAWPR